MALGVQRCKEAWQTTRMEWTGAGEVADARCKAGTHGYALEHTPDEDLGDVEGTGQYYSCHHEEDAGVLHHSSTPMVPAASRCLTE